MNVIYLAQCDRDTFAFAARFDAQDTFRNTYRSIGEPDFQYDGDNLRLTKVTVNGELVGTITEKPLLVCPEHF